MSVIGSTMTGCIHEQTSVDINGTATPAVTVQVAGEGFHYGTSVAIVDPDDPLSTGFLLR